jgi:carotenoid cleavage dioxygenase-like enzyme
MQTKFEGGPFASQGLVKVDLCNRTVAAFLDHQPGQYPHEVAFIPRPNGTGVEDDGVLVGHVLDGPGNVSFVQVVDAKTLKRLARVDLPLRLGEMIHGNWW